MKTNRKLTTFAVLMWVSALQAATFQVGSSEQLAKAFGKLSPGDTVVLADGIYVHEGLTISNLQATSTSPVLVKAENTGAVQWKGFLHIVDSAYITVEGMVFNQSLASRRKEVQVHVLNSRHCRITRCSLDLDETGIPRNEDRYWLFLEAGRFNEVDHCVFNDKMTKHAPLKIIYDEYAPFIHHNFFPLHTYGEGKNGYETLQLGAGSTGTHGRKMHAIIEYNLFANCDGEAEIISLKTGSNTVRFNTFVGCKGKVVLRMADHCAIYNNYFFNPEGKTSVGGIRIHGSYNDIYNNYFDGLTAPVFESWAGDTDTTRGSEEKGYRQSKDNRLVFNTAYDCKGHILYFRGPSKTYPLPPKDWKIMNNLFVFANTNMVGGASAEQNFAYENNIAYSLGGPADLGREFSGGQFRVLDPLLVRYGDGVWRQQSVSPTIGSASPLPSWAHWNDLDGQARDALSPDIGADEEMESTIFRHPLTPEQVGPFARLPESGKPENQP